MCTSTYNTRSTPSPVVTLPYESFPTTVPYVNPINTIQTPAYPAPTYPAPTYPAPTYTAPTYLAPAQALTPSPTPAPASHLPEHVPIGRVLISRDGGKDVYQCVHRQCEGKTFGRLADLKRHRTSCHKTPGLKQDEYFCPVPGCPRSKNGRKDPFPRKDKMVDHLTKAHNEDIESK